MEIRYIVCVLFLISFAGVWSDLEDDVQVTEQTTQDHLNLSTHENVYRKIKSALGCKCYLRQQRGTFRVVPQQIAINMVPSRHETINAALRCWWRFGGLC